MRLQTCLHTISQVLLVPETHPRFGILVVAVIARVVETGHKVSISQFRETLGTLAITALLIVISFNIVHLVITRAPVDAGILPPAFAGGEPLTVPGSVPCAVTWGGYPCLLLAGFKWGFFAW